MIIPTLLKKFQNMLNIKNLIPALLFFSLSDTSTSQEIYDLSRCIVTGLEQNFSVKVARNKEEIAGNNYTRGNAGFLPKITNTNRFGGNVTSTTQNMNDDTKRISKGTHNTTGSAALNLNMTLFNGFSVQTTYQKLNELKQVGELNTQMSMENLISRIVAEYYYYIQQHNYSNNMEYAVSLPVKECVLTRNVTFLAPRQSWNYYNPSFTLMKTAHAWLVRKRRYWNRKSG